ncbi:DUF397 domain-containing protein [Streptomyces sp. NPDC091217]|uniref:DUF397 domain-containing protein n=1 Tax=Streptomyces sp. NPDC091217 TaxID=3365975 RepID=UPI00383069C7
MRQPTWQKSSYYGEGDSCIHISTTPAAFATLLTALKQRPAPEDSETNTPVRLRSTDTVVTTDRRKWNAFVLGLQAGEFDHFTAQPTVPAAAESSDLYSPVATAIPLP